MLIRRPRPDELGDVRALVVRVVDEVYGVATEAAGDWSLGWVAMSKTALAGVVLTSADTIDDLWIAVDARGRGIGSALLARGEQEILERGFSIAKLRVGASNANALSFYGKRGWSQVRTYPHERTGVPMIDYKKPLS